MTAGVPGSDSRSPCRRNRNCCLTGDVSPRCVHLTTVALTASGTGGCLIVLPTVRHDEEHWAAAGVERQERSHRFRGRREDAAGVRLVLGDVGRLFLDSIDPLCWQVFRCHGHLPFVTSQPRRPNGLLSPCQAVASECAISPSASSSRTRLCSRHPITARGRVSRSTTTPHSMSFLTSIPR